MPSARRGSRSLLALFLPEVDHLAQLPVKSAFIFGFDPDAAHADPENAAILAADSARTVLSELASRVRAHTGPVTPEDFKGWINEIKAATGVKGKELFHPDPHRAHRLALRPGVRQGHSAD